MQYKLIIILILVAYIFSGHIYENTNNINQNHTMNLQEEIYIDESDIQVFEKKSVKNISVIEKKVKAWIIEIKYDDENTDIIKNKLVNNGYKLKDDKKKMIFSIGPFTAKAHAKEESSKLIKTLGIDNKISSFIF
tara:strand:+ start:2888 stop:3292 length:405 start_codon:yes stop_codon:yes gene_type:complete